MRSETTKRPAATRSCVAKKKRAQELPVSKQSTASGSSNVSLAALAPATEWQSSRGVAVQSDIVGLRSLFDRALEAVEMQSDRDILERADAASAAYHALANPLQRWKLLEGGGGGGACPTDIERYFNAMHGKSESDTERDTATQASQRAASSSAVGEPATGSTSARHAKHCAVLHGLPHNSP